MKRWLILIALLMSSVAWAGSTTVVVGQGAGGGGETFCSSCSGALVFCWEITADDASPAEVNITESGGCSIGDTTGTQKSAVDIDTAPTGKTGYAVTWASSADYYTFSVSTGDIFQWDEGTLVFDFYLTTLGIESEIFKIYADASNRLSLVFSTASDELSLVHRGNGSSVTLSTTAADITTNTWYTVTAKWRTGATDPSMSLQIDSTTPVTTNTNLNDWTTEPGADSMYIGNSTGNLNKGSIKNIKVYNAWQ